MPAPSVKTAIAFLGLGHEDATVLVAILRRAAGSNKRVEKAMEAANELIQGYGVGTVRGKVVDEFFDDAVALYVNTTGELYSGAVIYDTVIKAFAITTLGDWLKTNGVQYGVF